MKHNHWTNDDNLAEDRRALSVRCPVCYSEPGENCWDDHFECEVPLHSPRRALVPGTGDGVLPALEHEGGV